MGSWEDDSNTSRFGPEGEQEPYVAGLKRLTSKPVVGVGRFTSPDLMVRQVKSGIRDLIGAARPSIADPFLTQNSAMGEEWRRGWHPEFIRPRESGKRILVVGATAWPAGTPGRCRSTRARRSSRPMT